MLVSQLNILESKKFFKYKHGCIRRGKIIVNNDQNLNLEERYRGGYNILNPNQVKVINVEEHFDKTLIQLDLSIPYNYKTFPVEFLIEKKQEIVDIIQRYAVQRDGLTHFGLMVYLVIKISKQTPDQNERWEYIYLNSHRYILIKDEVNTIFDIIAKWHSKRVDNMLKATMQSGWNIDSIELFNQ